MVELIRRVIPRDIVGGNVLKLRRMDATVHILYEVAGTAGAFASAAIILSVFALCVTLTSQAHRSQPRLCARRSLVPADRAVIITPCCCASSVRRGDL